MKKKSTTFLKLIIAYKTLMGLFEIVLAISSLNLLNQNLEEAVTKLAVDYKISIDNPLMSYILQQAGMMGNGTILAIVFVIFTFGVLNLIESYGLHLKRRWAEWLTVIATSILIPFEMYGVAVHISPLKLLILVLNILIVYYLAKHKELFKSKSKRSHSWL